MKIAYLHGLESSIDPKDPKIVWLNNNFKSVYTPKIDYKKKGSFSTILRTIKNMDPHYIVGSSMGGYFAYLIGSKLGIKTILFNPAVVGRSFDPFVGDIDIKGRNGHNLFLGKSDNVINGDDVRKFFGDSGMANVNTEYYSGGHRVPVDVFINSIKKVSGVNEIYNNIQNKHKVMEKFDQFVNEKTSLSQLKKIIKTKEYKEISKAFDGAEEVGDIWNMLDPKMFKFTESEFEDIFDEWWNDQSYDSLGEFATGGSTEDMISLYNQLLPYVIESEVTEKREDVGKYNTVKKVIAELGRRPSEQELATFINNNYYDVTEVERGEDDPAANDKIADLVGFYKFDIEDWETAWADAQNESVVNEAKNDLKVGDTGVDYNDNVVEIIAIGRFAKIAKMFKKETKEDAEEYGIEELMVNTDYYLTKNIESPEGNVGDYYIYPVRYDMANYWGLDPLDESVVTENTVTFTLDDGDLDDKFLSDKSLSRNLDYKEDGRDTYYVLPKRDFDRLQDWADSSGYDTDEVIEVIDESVVTEAVSRATKIYQIATPAPKAMLVEELEDLFGDDYRHIVTEFDDDEGYESVLVFNLTPRDIKRIQEEIADVLIWEYSIKKGKEISESEQHSLQTNKINESETVYHKYDFEGMWAQKLGMTREEYVAHFATMTVGVDESSAKDYNGIQFDVKGINFTYTDVGRFYGASIYDVPKTANVSKRAKFSLSEITQFLASIGIKDEVPVRYDTKDLDKICKKLAKQGIVCDHDDSMDVS